MPVRRKERSLAPYFTKSGQGKLFYEPDDVIPHRRRDDFQGDLSGRGPEKPKQT